VLEGGLNLAPDLVTSLAHGLDDRLHLIQWVLLQPLALALLEEVNQRALLRHAAHRQLAALFQELEGDGQRVALAVRGDERACGPSARLPPTLQHLAELLGGDLQLAALARDPDDAVERVTVEGGLGDCGGVGVVVGRDVVPVVRGEAEVLGGLLLLGRQRAPLGVEGRGVALVPRLGVPAEELARLQPVVPCKNPHTKQCSIIQGVRG
jgi:hypothetical protein